MRLLKFSKEKLWFWSWTADAQESRFFHVQQFRDKSGTVGDDDPQPDQLAQQLGSRGIHESDRGQIETDLLQSIERLPADIPQFIHPGTE
jgi:hypothetical protein